MSRTSTLPTADKLTVLPSWHVRGIAAPKLTRRHALILGASALGLATVGAGAAHAHEVAPPKAELFPMEPRLVPMDPEVPPGEIHVVPDSFELYWTMPDAQAWLYRIRVGRAGLYESGRFYIGAKKEWPSWTPTPDIV